MKESCVILYALHQEQLGLDALENNLADLKRKIEKMSEEVKEGSNPQKKSGVLFIFESGGDIDVNATTQSRGQSENVRRAGLRS